MRPLRKRWYAMTAMVLSLAIALAIFGFFRFAVPSNSEGESSSGSLEIRRRALLARLDYVKEGLVQIIKCEKIRADIREDFMEILKELEAFKEALKAANSLEQIKRVTDWYKDLVPTLENMGCP